MLQVEALATLVAMSDAQSPDPKSLTWGDVKALYRAASLKTHPDKGGDPQAFRQVHQAWQAVQPLKEQEKMIDFKKMLDLEKGTFIQLTKQKSK